MAIMKEISPCHKKKATLPSCLYRQLGPSESLALRINDVTPHNIVACVEVEGKLLLSEIKKNFQLCQKRNILLRCKIVNNSFVFTEEKPKFCFSQKVINETINFIENRMSSLVSMDLKENLRPPIYFELVQYDSDQYLFFIVAQHTISDGISVASLILELLSKQPSTTPLKILNAPPLEELIPSSVRSDQLIGKGYLDFLEKEKTNRNCELVSHRATGMKVIGLDSNLTKRIKDVAAHLNVTVTSFLASVFSLSLSQLLSFSGENCTNICCNILVNLRKYLTREVCNDQLGFYSGHMPVQLRFQEESSFGHIATSIHQALYEKLEKGEQFFTTKQYKSWITSEIPHDKILDFIKVEAPSVGISNMGIIEESPFTVASGLFKAMYIGVTCHAYSRNENTFFVCLLTCKNKMSINIHFPLPVFSRERAEELSLIFNSTLINIINQESK